MNTNPLAGRPAEPGILVNVPRLVTAHYTEAADPAVPSRRLAFGTTLAGEEIQKVLTHAPGNDAPIGGLKVVVESGWSAVRLSGTENIYKIYAESLPGADHLLRI